MVGVLGEIPDRNRALMEIKRVLKDDGVLAIGELLPDPDYPLRKTVIRLCNDAGFQQVDGYGGIHLSSPALPRPDGLPYFWRDDIARDLEILEKDGELTFVIMDGYGRLYVVGPNAADVSMDAPLFGSNMARDLEPAPGGDGWLVMDAYGALFDSRDHSVSVAAGTYWLDTWFARDISIFPDETTLMVDSYGGRHYAEGKSPLNRLYPIPSELYFWGWEIVWDFEFIK